MWRLAHLSRQEPYHCNSSPLLFLWASQEKAKKKTKTKRNSFTDDIPTRDEDSPIIIKQSLTVQSKMYAFETHHLSLPLSDEIICLLSVYLSI